MSAVMAVRRVGVKARGWGWTLECCVLHARDALTHGVVIMVMKLAASYLRQGDFTARAYAYSCKKHEGLVTVVRLDLLCLSRLHGLIAP